MYSYPVLADCAAAVMIPTPIGANCVVLWEVQYQSPEYVVED
jgi:hypothetical protein